MSNDTSPHTATRTGPEPGDNPPLEALSPSSKFVAYVLEAHGGSIMLEDLQEETTLNRRTLRYAISRLEEQGLVERKREPSDPRYSRVEKIR